MKKYKDKVKRCDKCLLTVVLKKINDHENRN